MEAFRRLVEALDFFIEIEGFAAFLRSKFGPSGLKNVELLLDKRRGILELEFINISKDKRGEGVGSDVMREICKYADSNGYIITLSLAERNSDTGTTSKERLRQFYGRFGFVSNRGRNKDFSLSLYTNMYRLPR